MIPRILLAAALAVGCSTEFVASERPQFWNGTNTLTLFLFDAQSGAGVTDADVSLRIGATVLTATGEANVYTFAQVPFGTYPIFINAPGYLEFVATRSFTSNASLNSPTSTRAHASHTVALFPVKTVDADFTVRVFEGESGAAAASGQLVAALDTSAAITSPTPALAEPLQGTLGFFPRTLTVPLADGVATLPAAELVFGATYRLSVINVRDADGRYLEPVLGNDRSFKAGLGAQELLLFVGPPAITPVALSANNEDADAFVSKLVVRFPYPVELCSDVEDHGWENLVTDGPTDGRDSDDDGEITLPVEDGASVKVTRSEGGAVVTLDYLADDEDKDDSLILRFSGVRVQVTGSARCTLLSSVGLRDTNDHVSTRINVREYDAPPAEVP